MKRIVFLVFFLLIGANSYAQQKKKTVAKSYTTEQAVGYAEDYFEFYEANTPYRNPIARKLYICTCYPKSFCYDDEGNERDCWQAKIYTLTIVNGGKYRMEEKFNY